MRRHVRRTEEPGSCRWLEHLREQVWTSLSLAAVDVALDHQRIPLTMPLAIFRTMLDRLRLIDGVLMPREPGDLVTGQATPDFEAKPWVRYDPLNVSSAMRPSWVGLQAEAPARLLLAHDDDDRLGRLNRIEYTST